jgi:hypothetical protein
MRTAILIHPEAARRVHQDLVRKARLLAVLDTPTVHRSSGPGASPHMGKLPRAIVHGRAPPAPLADIGRLLTTADYGKPLVVVSP